MKSNMRACERRVCPSNGRPASRTPLDPHSAGASRRGRECGGTRRLKVVRRRRSARQAVAVGPADPSGGNKARRLGSHADRNRARVGRQARSNLLTTAPAGRVLPLSYGFRIEGAAPMISAARVRRSTWLAALLSGVQFEVRHFGRRTSHDSWVSLRSTGRHPEEPQRRAAFPDRHRQGGLPALLLSVTAVPSSLSSPRSPTTTRRHRSDLQDRARVRRSDKGASAQ